ncbi:MAG: helix-turn-helix domain-containing protein [Acutalibacteraceae bacterium]
MDELFIRQRITQLRMQKNVSEYKMSMDLGHSKGYIQSITSGRALPSMSEFLTICDYFGITPLEFFDTNENEVILLKELNKEVSEMNKDDVGLLIQLAKRLNNKH